MDPALGGIGKVRAWAIAMLAAIAAFVWAAFLGPGDVFAFAIICALSGLALGADLALPPSILADVIDRRGAMASAGAYFGVWTLATKLNLALAAGIALPLLATLGYSPRARPMRLRSAHSPSSMPPCPAPSSSPRSARSLGSAGRQSRG